MMRRQFKFACVLVVAICGLVRQGVAADTIAPKDAVVPAVSGLDIKVGDTVVIMKGATYPSAFRFADGRIAVSGDMGFKGGESSWSADGGHTWKLGLTGPTNATLELGNGHVLSLKFKTEKAPNNKLKLPQMRSKDNWKTVEAEYSSVDVPLSKAGIGDDGSSFDGMVFDHALVRLKNGNLMASMYGCYKDDKVPLEGFPAMFKTRTIVVFSSDNGKTWGNPITVAYDPSVGQESFCEPDIKRMPGGDLLCVMRTGGNVPKWYPLYCTRSSDEGRTWSKPEPFTDRGVWPNLCVTASKAVACTYGRDGNWLVFSTDDGKTWKGAFCFYKGLNFGFSSSYNTVLEVSPDLLLVVYDRLVAGGDPKANVCVHKDQFEIVGTFVSVKKSLEKQ
jgi:hypothetical protein